MPPAIDHLVVLVRDLDAAADRWMRLGFTLTPRGLHSAHMGTANHCVMFGKDYVELLGVLTPTPGNAPWRERLSQREGGGAMALTTADARATAERLLSLGMSAGPVLDFARPVNLGAGPGPGTGEAAFAIARASGFADAGLDVFFCQHKTPDMVWRADWQDHPNGAQALAGVAMTAPEPGALATKFSALFGAEAVRREGDDLVIASATLPIRVSPAAVAGLRGFSIAVANLDRTAEALENGAIAHAHRPRSIEVAADDANGVALSFVEHPGR